MKIGVLAVQGAVQEHLEVLEEAMRKQALSGRAVRVKRVKELEEVSALIIPGGESTAISKLLQKNNLYHLVKRRAEEGMPIMGTCAGCILMAREGDEAVRETGTKLLSIMDMAVIRNAFGRQRESFEAKLSISCLDEEFKGVFIRAPAITRVWGRCSVVSRFENVIVMARQEVRFGLTFHPELSGDSRIHELFLGLV
ncbi:MAG: pyridoxal 5'-phosphate synthase glutaminase subunit PdxT [Thermoplasmata archaeon]